MSVPRLRVRSLVSHNENLNSPKQRFADVRFQFVATADVGFQFEAITDVRYQFEAIAGVRFQFEAIADVRFGC